uniref:Cytidine and dCMP deaminase domain-containing protein 1 n=1 Tax=Neogobius melanostomus TaxID=47308 RepID=A0A8C6SFP2_9GOBI
MEDCGTRKRAGPNRADGKARDRGVQTDSRGQGPAPRLSKGNLFTLLSLWMELFPQERVEEQDGQVNSVGLVVVGDSKVMGLHSSGSELHAGQAAILQHGAALSQSSLYFSRRPCSTCLKMLLNAGVGQICFWPGDPEVSMLENPSSHDASGRSVPEEAAWDALAADTLKSNSRAHICVPLQPLEPGLAQFVSETSRGGDFMERIAEDESGLDVEQLYNRERVRALASLSSRFLVRRPQEHQQILSLMKLETFCVEPYFSGLRHNMQELVQVLAAAVAGLPHHNGYGFYRWNSDAALSQSEPVSAEEALHCMIQAAILALRTEDPKVGVGAVIWAKAEQTGRLSFVGCGFNAYPRGSQCNEYPQMDDKQEDRQRRKYRYIVHAEQNALTFRTREIRRSEPTLLFVTKCPCDECVPLIGAAGVSHVFTTDMDHGRDKGDISYLRFQHMSRVSKFCWQKLPSPAQHSSSHFANGVVGKHSRQVEPERPSSKKLRTHRTEDSKGE